jgi:hypothetical protein
MARPLFLALACAWLLLPSCAQRRNATLPSAPRTALLPSPIEGGDAAPGGLAGFFPLAMGDTWQWQRHSVITIIPVSGTPPVKVEATSTIDGVIDCEEERGGQTYRVEHDVEHDGGSSASLWIRYREDLSGLYEADDTGPSACASDAAGGTPEDRLLLPLPTTGNAAIDRAWKAAAAKLTTRLRLVHATLLHGPRGGALAGELTRLRYPLRPGQSWIIRATPFFGVTVDAHEVLNVPAGQFAGWRMHEDSEFFGPHDLVQVWYGDQGLLRFADHLEGEATDEQGNVIGKLLFDEDRVLTAVSLVEPGRLVTAP